MYELAKQQVIGGMLTLLRTEFSKCMRHALWTRQSQLESQKYLRNMVPSGVA